MVGTSNQSDPKMAIDTMDHNNNQENITILSYPPILSTRPIRAKRHTAPLISPLAVRWHVALTATMAADLPLEVNCILGTPSLEIVGVKQIGDSTLGGSSHES